MVSFVVVQDKQHVLVTDRFFTSVKLLKTLVGKGMHLVGTVMPGRGIAKQYVLRSWLLGRALEARCARCLVQSI